jgi:cardiolipin synthase
LLFNVIIVIFRLNKMQIRFYWKEQVNRDLSYRFLTIPNLLSIFRILLIFPLAFYVWNDNLNMVALLVVIAFISDYLDGIIARHFNQISEWGKILDPLADKLSIGIMMVVLYLKQQVALWLVLIVVGRDVVIVLGGFFVAEKYKHITPSDFIGKVTANVLAIMVICYIFNIGILEQVFTPVGVFFVILSSYCYFKNFTNIQKGINALKK